MPRFGETPTIIGRRVRLRPIVAEDADAMFADLDDAQAMRPTGIHATFALDHRSPEHQDHGVAADLAT